MVSADSEPVEVTCCVSTLTLSRPLGAFPKCQTEVAHSPRIFGRNGVCSTMYNVQCSTKS